MWLKKIIQNIKPKTKSLLGIDINASSIRLVELSYSKSSYQVETCINVIPDVPTPDDWVMETLKKIIEQSQFKTKNVAVALAHAAIIFKEIKVAKDLTDKKLEDFLRFNIEQYVGEEANNISFDYQIIKAPSIKMDEQMVVGLVMVRREQVKKYTTLLRAASLHPKIIDVNSYVLERIVRRQFKNLIGLTAVINIDRSAILIIVIDTEKILYAHEDFVEHQEVESVAQIITQLKLKLPLVFASLHQPLAQIVLAGEKAVVPGLDLTINTEFNIKTAIINPFLNMKLSATVSQEVLQKIAPAMAISCGLALRVTDESLH